MKPTGWCKSARAWTLTHTCECTCVLHTSVLQVSACMCAGEHVCAHVCVCTRACTHVHERARAWVCACL